MNTILFDVKCFDNHETFMMNYDKHMSYLKYAATQ